MPEYRYVDFEGDGKGNVGEHAEKGDTNATWRFGKGREPVGCSIWSSSKLLMVYEG